MPSGFSQGLQLGIAPDRDLHVREVAGQLATYDAPHREMLATFCVDWVDDEMIERVSRGGSPWVAAEVWRAAGGAQRTTLRPTRPRVFYLRAIETARRQGAVAWEQRASQRRRTRPPGAQPVQR